MKIRLLFFMGLVFVLAPGAASPAQSQDSTPVAITLAGQEPAPGSEASSATPSIILRFSDPSQVPAKDQILLELDRVDVSALAQLTEGVLQFDPTSPLAAGSHEVRMTGTLTDGRSIQEITWSFTVPEPKDASNWDFGFEPSATWQFGIKQEGENPDKHSVNSNIAVNATGTGRIQTNITSNFNAQDTKNQNGENFDLANFTATFAAPSGTSVSLGDVQANFDSLAVANFARRGITFQQKLPFLQSGVDVFTARSESILGFRHGLGVSDSSQRVEGVSYFFSPFKSAEKLTFRVLYARGENAAEEGFNFGGFTRGSKGDAYGFALSSSLFSNQVHADFFGSWSDFDFNAADGFTGNKDEAFLGRLSYSPNPGTFHGRTSAFQLQLEIQDLGTFYKSLANPFLVADRLGFNVNSSWNWGIMGFTGGAAKFHDNVNNIAILPTVNNDLFSGGFSVTPQGTNGPPTLPSFTFNASRSEQESVNEVAAFLAVHNIIDTYGSVITLTRNLFSLSLNLSYALNEDLNNRVPDTDSKNATFGAGFTPKPSWNFGPSVSFTRTADRDSHIDSDLWTYSLTTGFPVVPDVLTLDGQISYSSTETSDFLNRNSSISGTAQLSFLFGQLLKTRGRQAFSIRMSYNENIVEAPFIQRQRGLEIFGTLDVSVPF